MGNCCGGEQNKVSFKNVIGFGKTDAAATIQAGVRGHQARKEYESRRQEWILRAPTHLEIKILSCRNLIAADLNGYSDPYVVIKHPHGPPLRTPVIKKTLNPVFNQAFIIAGVKRDSSIEIEVFDWDAISKDDCIGRCAIAFKELPIDEPRTSWLRLDGVKSGEVQVQLVLRDSKTKRIDASGYLAQRTNLIKIEQGPNTIIPKKKASGAAHGAPPSATASAANLVVNKNSPFILLRQITTYVGKRKAADILDLTTPSGANEREKRQTTEMSVEEGETSVEAVHFKVSQQIKGLKRIEVTFKGKTKIDTEVTEMGDFAAREEPYEYTFPPARIPTGYSARGSYVVRSTYTDANGNALHEDQTKVKIVKPAGAPGR